MGCGLDWSRSGLGEVAGSCECGNEASGSLNEGNFSTNCEHVSLWRRSCCMEFVCWIYGKCTPSLCFFFNVCLPKALFEFQVILLCLLSSNRMIKSDFELFWSHKTDSSVRTEINSKFSNYSLLRARQTLSVLQSETTVRVVNLMSVWPCIVDDMDRIKPTRCYTMVYWTLWIAQHVSGITMPIIRSVRLEGCFTSWTSL